MRVPFLFQLQKFETAKERIEHKGWSVKSLEFLRSLRSFAVTNEHAL